MVGLTKLAKSKSAAAQALAMRAIAGITLLLHPTKLPERQVKLAVQAAVKLLSESPDGSTKDAAMGALHSLAIFQLHAGCPAAVEAGTVPLVAEQLVSGSPQAQGGARSLLPWLLQTDKAGLAPAVVAAGGLDACVASIKTPGDSVQAFDIRTSSATTLMCLAQAQAEYAAAIAAAGAVGPYTLAVAETLQRRSLATQLPGLDAILEVGAKQAGVVEEALRAGALQLAAALLQHPVPDVVASAVGIATSMSAALVGGSGQGKRDHQQQQQAEARRKGSVAQLEVLVQPLVQRLQAWLVVAGPAAPPPSAQPLALALHALGNIALGSAQLHAAVSSTGCSQLAASWTSGPQVVPPQGGASPADAAQRLQGILSLAYGQACQQHTVMFKLTAAGTWGDADWSKVPDHDTRERCCAAKGCGASKTRDGKDLLSCSRCKVEFYCSVGCQKDHWKQHKKVCGKPRD